MEGGMKGTSRSNKQWVRAHKKKCKQEKSFSIILKVMDDRVILCRCAESTLLHYAISSSCSYFLLSRGL